MQSLCFSLREKMLPPIKQYLNKILTDIPKNHISNSYIAFSKCWINILAAMAMTEMVAGCVSFKTLNIFYMITCIAAGKVWWKGVKKNLTVHIFGTALRIFFFFKPRQFSRKKWGIYALLSLGCGSGPNRMNILFSHF